MSVDLLGFAWFCVGENTAVNSILITNKGVLSQILNMRAIATVTKESRNHGFVNNVQRESVRLTLGVSDLLAGRLSTSSSSSLSPDEF